jgi:ribosomal silencing factor RsfS
LATCCQITEYFVVTSRVEPAAGAHHRRLDRGSGEGDSYGRSPLRTEGLSEQQWVLDRLRRRHRCTCSTEETRAYYEIERLYRDVAPARVADRSP